MLSHHPSTVEFERMKGELRQERADLARWKTDYAALQQQLAQVAKVADQIESAAASAVRNRDERIEAAIARDGVWSSSRNPEIARKSAEVDIQTDIVKRLRKVLAGEGQC